MTVADLKSESIGFVTTASSSAFMLSVCFQLVMWSFRFCMWGLNLYLRTFQYVMFVMSLLDSAHYGAVQSIVQNV